MTIRYQIVPMKFDTEAWSRLMSSIETKDIADFAYMFGIAPETVRVWRSGHYHPKAPYPNMTNFTAICNWLDVNPQTFFILDESEKNSDERA